MNLMKRFVLGLTVAISLLFSIMVVLPTLAGDDDEVDVIEFENFPPGVYGTSELRRDDDGISFEIETTEVGDKEAITLRLFIDDDLDAFLPFPGLEPYEIALNVDGRFSKKVYQAKTL